MSIILVVLRIYVVSGAQERMLGRRPGGSAESCGHLSSGKNSYVKNSGRPKGGNAYGLRDGVVASGSWLSHAALAKPVSQVRYKSSTPSGRLELETLRADNSRNINLVNDEIYCRH